LAHARLTIIGCGNPVRSDDGAGVAVLQALRGHALPADVALIDAGTSGLEVMFQVRGARRVIIVDACRSGSEPGAVFRLPGREAMTPVPHRPSACTACAGTMLCMPAAACSATASSTEWRCC
jgi:hydrogenase maturation protease